jgi:hypothetical protein
VFSCLRNQNLGYTIYQFERLGITYLILDDEDLPKEAIAFYKLLPDKQLQNIEDIHEKTYLAEYAAILLLTHCGPSILEEE